MGQLAEISLLMVVFFLCINGGILIYAELDPASGIGTPFNSSNVTAATQTGLLNVTDTSFSVSQNLTGQIENATEPASTGFLNPVDTLLYPIQILQTFAGVLTGSFVGDALAVFGFDPIFTFVIQSIFAFFLAITIIHAITGRF